MPENCTKPLRPVGEYHQRRLSEWIPPDHAHTVVASYVCDDCGTKFSSPDDPHTEVECREIQAVKLRCRQMEEYAVCEILARRRGGAWLILQGIYIDARLI